jgi:hypothetical protein
MRAQHAVDVSNDITRSLYSIPAATNQCASCLDGFMDHRIVRVSVNGVHRLTSSDKRQCKSLAYISIRLHNAFCSMLASSFQKALHASLDVSYYP